MKTIEAEKNQIITVISTTRYGVNKIDSLQRSIYLCSKLRRTCNCSAKSPIVEVGETRNGSSTRAANTTENSYSIMIFRLQSRPQWLVSNLLGSWSSKSNPVFKLIITGGEFRKSKGSIKRDLGALEGHHLLRHSQNPPSRRGIFVQYGPSGSNMP